MALTWVGECQRCFKRRIIDSGFVCVACRTEAERLAKIKQQPVEKGKLTSLFNKVRGNDGRTETA